MLCASGQATEFQLAASLNIVILSTIRQNGRQMKLAKQISRVTPPRRGEDSPSPASSAALLEAPSPLEPWRGDRVLARDAAEALLPLSLPEQIADRVCEGIMSGEYGAGQRIQEQMLSETFRVSRGPVREALLMLEREGLVKIEPRRGARVKSLSVTEVGDLFAVRATLLGLAGRLFTERASTADLQSLSEGIERMAAHVPPGGDPDAYSRWSYALSLFMAEKAGNPHLYRMLHSIARQTYSYSRLALGDPARRKDSIARWRKALARARAQDAQGVEDLTRALIDATRKAAAVALLSDATARRG